MNWEEYQNTDWYRESHQSDDYRTKEERIADEKENLMRNYLSDLDEYREQHDGYFETSDGELYEKTDYELVEVEGEEPVVMRVTYVCCTTWNGRVNGMLCSGSYQHCRMKKYEYDLSHMNSEWQWAAVEKITYSTNDELEEILDGYRELACEPYCDYDDYDYDY